MIFLATALLLAATMTWGVAQYRFSPARVRARSGRPYTFLVDPPTMFIVAMLGVMAGFFTRKGRRLSRAQFLKRRTWVDRALVVFILGFWCMELLSYFDVMKHPFDPTRSGNDFMWNGYVEWLTGPLFHWPQATYHYWWSWPLLAGMLLLQWLALRFGRAIGYMNAYFGDMDNWSKTKRQ